MFGVSKGQWGPHTQFSLLFCCKRPAEHSNFLYHLLLQYWLRSPILVQNHFYWVLYPYVNKKHRKEAPLQCPWSAVLLFEDFTTTQRCCDASMASGKPLKKAEIFANFLSCPIRCAVRFYAGITQSMSAEHMWVGCRRVWSQAKPNLAWTTNGTKTTAHLFSCPSETPTCGSGEACIWLHIALIRYWSQAKPGLVALPQLAQKRRHTNCWVVQEQRQAGQVDACIWLIYITLPRHWSQAKSELYH